MDNLQQFTRQLRDRLSLVLFVNNVLIVLDWWLADQVFKLAGWWFVAALFAAPLLSVTLLPWLSARYFTEPMKLLWQAILHLSPDGANVAAPNLKRTGWGGELVTNLAAHVYQLANISAGAEREPDAEPPASLAQDFVAASLPLPLIILDKTETVLFANQAMLQYIGQDADSVAGQSVYRVLDLSFGNEQTLDRWLADAKRSKLTATRIWRRVRLALADADGSGAAGTRLFDLAAYYNRNNPRGYETMLVLFDHTKQYAADDQAMNFVALAVHELRTPLTLLRGYIEALDEELAGKLDPELAGFLQKMTASGQQLATFVSTILNVARVEDDQLTLRLRQEKWPAVLQTALDTMRLRAQVYGIALELHADSGLPDVGIDKTSMTEVLINLIDNAIKYSGTGKRIVLRAHATPQGMVETTVQDFGVGIPASAIPHLFQKFYRDPHKRGLRGGTGLGLYLCKAVVGAHGGNIWVNSREGQGTTFGFTVPAYAQLAAEQKVRDTESNSDIVRVPHGWIKNHSLYRR